MPPFTSLLRPRWLKGLDPQQSSRGLVRQEIQEPIWTLPHFANPLLQLQEERLSPGGQAPLIHHDHLKLLADECAHEDVALPLWESVARVNRHAREGDGRRPEQPRLLQA